MFSVLLHSMPHLCEYRTWLDKRQKSLISGEKFCLLGGYLRMNQMKQVKLDGGNHEDEFVIGIWNPVKNVVSIKCVLVLFLFL